MLTIKEINKFIYLNCRVKHKADMIIAVFIAVKSTVREDLKNPGLNKNEDLYIDFHLLMVIINSLINWPIALIAQLLLDRIFQVFPHCCLNSIEKFPAIEAGLYISRAHVVIRSVGSSALY